jgi:hypothetical protein
MRSGSDRRLTRGTALTAVLAVVLPVVLPVVLTVLVAAPARAAAAPDQAPAADASEAAHPPSPPVSAERARPDFPPLAHRSLSHESQFGIAVLGGSGFRALVPYQEETYCGKLNERVCSARLPAFLDLQPSFGLSVQWDLLVDLRFGLEADFARTHQFAVAPGFRYWIDPQSRLKFFATLQIAFDTTEQHNPALTGFDLAFHNSNGLMFEVMRDLGFYVQLGDTIGFVRWLRFEIDLGVGVQARFP